MGKALVIVNTGGTDVEDGNPNAKAEHVLSGYTFYAKEPDPITGTMSNQGSALTKSLSPGNSVTVEKGWYAGNRVYNVVSLSSQTSATAGAAQVLKDYTGWKDGSKITGTMVNRGAISQSLSANGTYAVPAGWHNGSGKVTQSLTTQAAKTITPGTSQQTIVSSNVWVTGGQTVSGNSNLTAVNIKKGVTIFGVSGSYEGFVDNPVCLIYGTNYYHGIDVTYSSNMNIGTEWSSGNQIASYPVYWWYGRDNSGASVTIKHLPKFKTISNITGQIFYRGRVSSGSELNGFGFRDSIYLAEIVDGSTNRDVSKSYTLCDFGWGGGNSSSWSGTPTVYGISIWPKNGWAGTYWQNWNQAGVESLLGNFCNALQKTQTATNYSMIQIHFAQSWITNGSYRWGALLNLYVWQ